MRDEGRDDTRGKREKDAEERSRKKDGCVGRVVSSFVRDLSHERTGAPREGTSQPLAP